MTSIQVNSIRGILVSLIAILVYVPTLLHASPYSDAVNALNPDAYYQGDEGSGLPQDTTGNGHHLSNYGTNTYGSGPTSADGFGGMAAAHGAYQFTGPQVARSGEGTAKYTPAGGQDPRTIVAWVNIDSPGKGAAGPGAPDPVPAALGGAHNIWQYGVDFGGPNTFTGWNLNIEEAWNPGTGAGTGQQNVHLNIQGRQIAAIDSQIAIGKWHMIAVAFEGDGTTTLGNAKIWVDNVAQTTYVQDVGAVPNTTGTDGPSLGFRLGQGLGGFGFNGRVDHVSVHTESLSDSDISGLWAAANVPEPTTAALVCLAGLGLMSLTRRRHM